MTIPELQADPHALSTMLQTNPGHRHEWSQLDLRDMLAHQLAAPLHLALGPLSAEVTHFLETGQGPFDSGITLRELLAHQSPPLELLILVKRFAKICRRSPDNPLPSEIVMFLYYASITAATTQLNEAISDLNDASMIRGLQWLCAQPWMSGEMRTMLQERLDVLLSRSPAKSK
jgi:hypothetical protein